MCDECRQTPCHYRCPNADEPGREEIAICGECEEPIYDDEDYLYFYKIDYHVCEDCKNQAQVYA